MTTMSDSGGGIGPPVTAGFDLLHASGIAAASVAPDRVRRPALASADNQIDFITLSSLPTADAHGHGRHFDSRAIPLRLKPGRARPWRPEPRGPGAAGRPHRP